MEDAIFKNTYSEEIYSLPSTTTIIISTPWSTLQQPEKELLEKILNAVGFSTASVRVVCQVVPNLEALRPKPDKVLVFSAPVKGIGMHEVIDTPSTAAVFTHPLKQLLGDDDAKRKLWLALKPLFGR